jgi:hypothetical protein
MHEDSKPGESTQRRRWAWLSHPLLLLLIGGAFTAGITNYLIPSITRQWQNHDKELELKSGLVTTTNRAAFDFFESIRLIEYAAKPKTLAPLDRAYVRWLTSTAVISAEMNTYFPSEKLNRDLRDLYLTTQVIYTLFKTSNPTGRGEVISENPRLFEHEAFKNLVAEPLQEVDVNQEWYRYDTDLSELESVMAGRVGKLTDDILQAHSSL